MVINVISTQINIQCTPNINEFCSLSQEHFELENNKDNKNKTLNIKFHNIKYTLPFKVK